MCANMHSLFNSFTFICVFWSFWSMLILVHTKQCAKPEAFCRITLERFIRVHINTYCFILYADPWFEPFLDFQGSFLTYPIEICIISPKPKPVKPYFNLVKPYQWQVWMLILIAVSMVTAAMWLVDGSDRELWMEAAFLLLNQSKKHLDNWINQHSM